MPDESKTPTYDALSPKDRRLVDVYLSNGMVQWKAYFEVIYSGDEKDPRRIGEHCRVNSSRKFADDNISQAIEERLSVECMSTNEALARLADHARAEYSQYFDEKGRVDLAALIADGKAHLIRETDYKGKDANQLVVKFHDVQGALDKILRAHGAYKDRMELTGAEGGPITVKVNVIRPGQKNGTDA